MKKVFSCLIFTIAIVLISSAVNFSKTDLNTRNQKNIAEADSVTATNNTNSKIKKLPVYGKIISKAEADSLFGPVLDSVVVAKDSLNNLIKLAKNYIMFDIINHKLIVLTQGRKHIAGNKKAYSDTTKFHVFSLGQLVKLIATGKRANTDFELRKNVLSITNGDATMEFSGVCPPICP